MDDNANVLSALKLLLTRHFGHVTLLRSPSGLISALRENKPDAVLLDMNFSAGINTGNEGIFWLSEIKKNAPEIPVVLFTAYAEIELAVRALKEGATDFVVKPWDNAKLVATLKAAVELRNSRREIKRLREKQDVLNRDINGGGDIFWGSSPVMLKLLETVKKVAATDADVLITGENGSGKEIIAKKIHNLSRRSSETLVTVDMGSISESLFESELFGHVKGAFTDARTGRAGKFEAAHKGTLFLDEIGNLGYALQAKLLSALQSRRITRVGSNESLPVDIRLISATNTDLARSVREGRFREDLFYRINTIHLEVPPLRERGDDVTSLAGFFLSSFSKKYSKNGLAFSPEAVKAIENHSWPGNVRELKHSVEKAVILCGGCVITPSDLSFTGVVSSPHTRTPRSLDEMEAVMVREALEGNGWNVSAAAGQLGITRPTMYSKMKKHGLA